MCILLMFSTYSFHNEKPLRKICTVLLGLKYNFEWLNTEKGLAHLINEVKLFVYQKVVYLI